MSDPVLSRNDAVQLAIIDFRAFAQAIRDLPPGVDLGSYTAIAHFQSIIGWHALTESERNSLDDYISAAHEDCRLPIDARNPISSSALRQRVALIHDFRLMNRVIGASRAGHVKEVFGDPVVLTIVLQNVNFKAKRWHKFPETRRGAGAPIYCMLDCCQSCETHIKTGLRRCSGCKLSWYCSPKCQAADWKYHKRECAQNRAEYTPMIEQAEAKAAADATANAARGET